MRPKKQQKKEKKDGKRLKSKPKTTADLGDVEKATRKDDNSDEEDGEEEGKENANLDKGSAHLQDNKEATAAEENK